MKKIFTVAIVLFLFTAKSNAQTQFPFYGFELSNYEVGDTLEYSSTSWNAGHECFGNDLYCILKKEVISGNELEIYSVQHINSILCEQLYSQALTDTFKSTITNDTVYNNRNNILSTLLYQFDTSSRHFDTAFIKYDTIQNLKKLKLKYATRSWSDEGYDVIQDIGIVDIYFNNEGQESSSTVLSYAHLTHYGIYGTYYKLFDGLKKSPIPLSAVTIFSDNKDNSFLQLISGSSFINATLYIYDLLGRTVKTQPVTEGNNQINITSLPKEMYLYKVESNGNILGQGKLMNIKD